ncbi:MAG: HAMP domain-containing protein [Sandaracinaceae bacterium]
MATQAEQMKSQGVKTRGGGRHQRRLRNYLLVPSFQLKYTGMVVMVTVLVTAAVGTWLGLKAYQYSHEMTQMMVMQGGLDDEFEFFREQAEAQDRQVALNIVLGILILVAVLAVSLGLTGILITHRVVGPAYKLKLLFRQVERGNLAVRGGFRRGDELQDVGEAFKEMMVAVRARRNDDLAQLDRALERAVGAQVDPELVAELRALRTKIAGELGS